MIRIRAQYGDLLMHLIQAYHGEKAERLFELCFNNLKLTSCLRNNHVVGMVRDPAHYGESDTRGESQRTKYEER